MARRGGLGPRGGAWVRSAAAHQVHDAEVVDDELVPAGTPALLSVPEAVDVLAVLEAAVVATPPGAARDRVTELARVLADRLEPHLPR
ncbi:hypothetical protein [Nocardiopsis dassonvillei]|uniref:hypothetical protein n=1 Tax=Nocardiopsis dassonvillei TaxID=2014 RepID=UPI003F56C21F